MYSKAYGTKAREGQRWKEGGKTARGAPPAVSSDLIECVGCRLLRTEGRPCRRRTQELGSPFRKDYALEASHGVLPSMPEVGLPFAATLRIMIILRCRS